MMNELEREGVRKLVEERDALKARVNEHLELYNIIDKLEAENARLREFIQSQEPLGAEFAKVWDDNADALYEDSKAALKTEE